MIKNDNLKGAFYMAMAMLGFSANDAIVKSVTSELNVGQIIFVRGLFASVLILAIAKGLGALRPIRTVMSVPVIVRSLCEVGAAVCYIYALGKIPIANTSAILQAMPLAVTLGAAVFYREPVGWRRWTAIIVGFAGVLVIVRPSAEGFNFASLVCVLSMMTAAIRDLATKAIDKEISAIFVTLVSAVIVTVAGALMIEPMGGWHELSWNVFFRLFLSSLGLFLGYQGIVLTMRTGEISFIAPFRYTSLLWSILFGILFFSEIPDLWMIVGSIIVIGSGLYTFYRESQRRRRAAAETVPNGI